MPSILILDDDADHRRVIRHILEKMYPAVGVGERDEALTADPDLIPDIQNYDLVIMDNTVAGQDSLGWMKAVMAQYPDKPAFIVLSSAPDTTPMIMQQMVIAIRQGVINFCFKKKLDMERLMGDISGVMGEVVEHEPTEEEDPNSYQAYKQSLEETASESGLALEMLQGHKQWPFTMDAILSGNATMGEFRIEAFLGEDNTASTFRATRSDSGEQVALKIINRLRVSGKTIPESFIENFKALEQLDHLNIIKMLSYGVVEDRMIVAMEYLDGGTLDERMARSRLDEGLAIHFFRQLLEGIAALHELGFELHQLVPRQLMLRDPDTLVIIQTGLIKGLHALSEITGDWPLPFNTPIYTTPEGVQKQPTDNRSDIYLAGLIGYEMLAGEPPFSEGSDQDIMYAHAAEPVPQISEIGQPINRLLAEMLAKAQSQRPDSVKAVLLELNRIYPE